VESALLAVSKRLNSSRTADDDPTLIEIGADVATADINWLRISLCGGQIDRIVIIDWNVEGFFSLSWMTTRPERFRVKAVECYVAAQKTEDLTTKDVYLELVRCWRELADEIEHFEHSWLDRGGI
jgi:hypothetical protein